jgi:Flp pilus assembly pilin Flp
LATLRQIAAKACASVACERGQTLSELTFILLLVLVGAVAGLTLIGGGVLGYFDEAGAAFP